MVVVAWAGWAVALVSLAVNIYNLIQQQPKVTVLLEPRYAAIDREWRIKSAIIVVLAARRQAMTLRDLSLHVFTDNTQLTHPVAFSVFQGAELDGDLFTGKSERRVEGHDAATWDADMTKIYTLVHELSGKEPVAIQAVATRYRHRSWFWLPGGGRSTAAYRSEIVPAVQPSRS